MSWVIPEIPELRKLKQEGGQVRACLGYRERLSQKWGGGGRGEEKVEGKYD